MVLSLGSGLQKGLTSEAFTEILLLMIFAMVKFFMNLSTQVDYQLDEWHKYYYAALKKVVVAKHKCERTRQIF